MESSKELNKVLRPYFVSYDALDIISKLGALNLTFDNQNKNLLLTYATLFGFANLNKEKPVISPNKFKQLIDCLNQSNIMPPIQDPAESPFFEKVFIDGEYYLFNGFNHSSVFIVDNIIKTIIYHGSSLPNQFTQSVLSIALCFAHISTHIQQSLNLTWDDIKQHNSSKEDIVVPFDLNKNKELLFIDETILLSFMSKEIVDSFLICNRYESSCFEKTIKEEYPFYYYRPLYKLESGNYLLIDPTSIGCFIREIAIELATKYDCKKEFLKKYHEVVLFVSEASCKILSGIHFYENKIDVDLNQGSDYHQNFYKISDKKALYVLCAFDQGYVDESYKSFNPDSIIKKAFKTIEEKGYNNDNIYPFILISPFGGIMSLSINYEFSNSPIILNCDELQSVFVNQEETLFFVENFSLVCNYYSSLGFVNHSNLIAVLYQKNYDLYFNDSFRVKGNYLNIGFELIYDYKVAASAKEKETAVLLPSFTVPLRLISTDDNQFMINPLSMVSSDKRLLYCPFKKGSVSIISEHKDVNGALMSRIIGYWLYQIKECLDVYNFSKLFIEIKSNDEKEFKVISDSSIKCTIKYSEAFLITDNSNNSNEIMLIIEILKSFDLFTNDVAILLQSVSTNKNKKIGCIIDPNESVLLPPLRDDIPIVFTSEIMESILEDEIGEYVIEKLLIPFGKASDSNSLANSIVSFLFDKFGKFLSRFDWKQSIEFAYMCSENTTRELLLENDNIKHQVALYPNHEVTIKERYNKINVSSVCTRFIVEYLSAIHTEGKEIMDFVDFQKAVTICNSIIKWANVSDAIHCNIAGNLTILKSYRIGFNKEKLNKLNSILSEVANYDISHPLDFSFSGITEWPFKDEMNSAYFEEYGFTTDDLMVVIAFLVSFGDTQDTDIKKATMSELLVEFHNGPTKGLTDETFLKVIDYISLKQRKSYFDGSVKNRQLYPWKYNRTHSLMRKPLINCGEYYLWGNRLVYHCYLFIMDTIFKGKEPTDTTNNKIMVVNGKILNHEGDVFNEYACEYLKTIAPNVLFKTKVNSVNGKRIEKTKHQPLGDIDILGIDSEKKRIYLIETKDFFYSRGPHELNTEIEEMFGPRKNKKSFVELELNRLDWAKNHIEDFKAEYKLSGEGWKLFYTFLSNKPLISSYFSKLNINQTSLKSITLKYLRSLK